MRNIWVMIVAGMVLAGVGVAIYRVTDDGPASRREAAPVKPAEPESRPTLEGGVPKSAGRVAAPVIRPDEQILGSASAPITIVEYASHTCPHCATFHSKILPKLKADYIDPGKVRLVYRDFPLDRIALSASKLAHCGGQDKFFGFIEVLFASQNQWIKSTNPVEALRRIGRLGGLTAAAVDICLKDEALTERILQSRLHAESSFRINSTPTLIIGDLKYPGVLEFEDLRKVLNSLLAKS